MSDWRSTVTQSVRNAKTRTMAKLLAGFEPGSTENEKIRLAMSVEDAIFRSATDFADYERRLEKKIKRVQKNYTVSPDAHGRKLVEAELQNLLAQYGDDLRYVLQNEEAALREMRQKGGEEKAKSLAGYIERAKVWARDLGIIGGQPNHTLTQPTLDHLKSALQNQLKTIRTHVIKLVDPEKFTMETLTEIGEAFKTNLEAVRIQSQVAAALCRKLQKAEEVATDAEAFLKSSLEEATRNIPLFGSRRGVEPFSDRVKTALAHLSKMRAAASVLMAYLIAPDKTKVPPGSLAKAHDVATTGIRYVQQVVREHRKLKAQQTRMQLADAWLKEIKMPGEAGPPILTPKVLLQGNRKAPGNLKSALQAKGAQFVEKGYVGPRVTIDFKVFCVKIYFSPLLVALRAKCDDEDWTPLHAGLEEGELVVRSSTKGSYGEVGAVVREELRDASARATRVLRKIMGNVKTEGNDLEIELLESSALLEFVELLRTTYVPPSS